MLRDEAKLQIIKVVHTAVWVFFNVVIAYMVYAVAANKIDFWLWLCYGLILLEGMILLIFNQFCPLTLWARKFSESTKENFDIYLPNWIAKYNKQIYTSIVVLVLIATVFRLWK